MKQAAKTHTSSHEMHYAIAEQGKVFALKNKHQDALKHYREAIKMAVSIKAPEVFFRHYTQCVLESLELTGAYDEVIEYCTNADNHYRGIKIQIPLHRKDHASTLERKGVNELKAGNAVRATESLKEAIEICGSGILPIAEELLSWLQRALHIDVGRLTALQRKYKYFVVRSDQVDANRARSLESLKKMNHKKTTALGELAI